MENSNENVRTGLVHRAVAFGLAVTTTAFLASGVAIVFTGSTAAVSHQIVHVAAAPVRALLGLA